MPRRFESRSETVSGVTYFDSVLLSLGATRPATSTISAGWRHVNTSTSPVTLEFWNGTSWISIAGGGFGDADTVDGEHANAIVTNARVDAAGAVMNADYSSISHAILANTAAPSNLSPVAMSQNSVIMRKGGDLLSEVLSASSWLGRLSSGNAGEKTMAELVDELLAEQSGTSFPGSPTDGQRFYHETHDEWFSYSSAASGWFGSETFQLPASGVETVGPNVYLRFPSHSLSGRYSSTIGGGFPFDVRCVLLEGNAAGTSTATVVLTRAGTNVGSPTVSWSSSSGRESSGRTLTGSTITSAGVIGMRTENNVGDSLDTGYFLNAHFRRFET